MRQLSRVDKKGKGPAGPIPGRKGKTAQGQFSFLKTLFNFANSFPN
jgi:hypothetical protein